MNCVQGFFSWSMTLSERWWKNTFGLLIGMGGLDLEITNNTDIKENLIEMLRSELPVLRAKARVSQEDIAKIIGISRQTYSSIERGNRVMSTTTFWALIAYFQNNASTKDMVDSIAGLSEGINSAIGQSKEIH